MSASSMKPLPFSPDSVANDSLKSIVERIEKLHEELADDVAAIYAEAKSNGYDLPALRYVLKLRALEAKNPDEYKRLMSVAETYMLALGMTKP